MVLVADLNFFQTVEDGFTTIPGGLVVLSCRMMLPHAPLTEAMRMSEWVSDPYTRGSAPLPLQVGVLPSA